MVKTNKQTNKKHHRLSGLQLTEISILESGKSKFQALTDSVSGYLVRACFLLSMKQVCPCLAE